MPRADATFVQPTLLTAVAATVGTSPALGAAGLGGKWIIRHIHISNTDSSARTVNVSIGADSVTNRLVSGKSIAANDVLDLYGIWEVPVSTVLQAFASLTSVVSIEISGTLNTP